MNITEDHSRDYEEEEHRHPPPVTIEEPRPGHEEEYIDDLVAQFNKNQDLHADIGDAVSIH